MKRVFTLILLLFLFSCNTNREEKLPEESVARVNGEYITRAQFKTRFERLLKAFEENKGREASYEEITELKNMILTSMIDKKVYTNEFSNLGLELDQGVVDSQVDYVISGFESREAFINELTKNGITEDEYRNEIEYQFIVKELGNYITNMELELSEDELKSYYSENLSTFYDPDRKKAEASHILIKSDLSDEEALKKITEIREEIVAGKSFSDAAAEYSQCPSSSDGGYLGEFTPGRMVKEFDEKVFSMDLNVVSEPVKTQFGYHLILTTKRVDSEYIPFDELREYLPLKIKEERFINDAQDKADIIRITW